MLKLIIVKGKLKLITALQLNDLPLSLSPINGNILRKKLKQLLFLEESHCKEGKLKLSDCEKPDCKLCRLFNRLPARVIFLPINLDKKSRMEFKYEGDRIIARISSGSLLKFTLYYKVFDEVDEENLLLLRDSFKLLEYDYLGSGGSRGAGKVRLCYWQERRIFL